MLAMRTARTAGRCAAKLLSDCPMNSMTHRAQKCGENVAFRYKLDLVQTQGGQFEFSATVSCPKCTHKSLFKRILASLHIQKFKAGPGGVEFEFTAG
jgi:hypothetical protein